jgi:hypothetical protein
MDVACLDLAFGAKDHQQPSCSRLSTLTFLTTGPTALAQIPQVPFLRKKFRRNGRNATHDHIVVGGGTVGPALQLWGAAATEAYDIFT